MKKRLFFITLFLFFVQLVVAQTWVDLDFELSSEDCKLEEEPNFQKGTDVYISEIYDNKEGSFGAIELYNPTNNDIDLSKFALRKRTEYDKGDWTTKEFLKGTIKSNSIVLIGLGYSDPNLIVCKDVNYSFSFGSSAGINENDQIQILKQKNLNEKITNKKNITDNKYLVLDDAKVDSTGTTIIRLEVKRPKDKWVKEHWTYEKPTCNNVGESPQFNLKKLQRDSNFCDSSVDVKVMITGGSGTYEIKQDIPSSSPYKDLKIDRLIDPKLPMGDYTYTIRDKKYKTCYKQIKFKVVQNPLPKTSPIKENIQ
ncbi:lamin tail domain-containing protein [Empedobacter falsenii]